MLRNLLGNSRLSTGPFKRRIGRISRNCHFRRKESDQIHFFGKKLIVKLLIIKVLLKYEKQDYSLSTEDV